MHSSQAMIWFEKVPQGHRSTYVIRVIDVERGKQVHRSTNHNFGMAIIDTSMWIRANTVDPKPVRIR